MSVPDAAASLCQSLAQALQQRGWMMATAESCTGGLIAAACTDLSGSSVWFERGFVTYSNLAKQQMLGVPESLLIAHGAVSEPVAVAMAQGAVQHSAAQVALSVTGIAGPSGGTADKPVGTVWFGWQVAGRTFGEHHLLAGDRTQVRAQTVQIALAGLLQRVRTSGQTTS